MKYEVDGVFVKPAKIARVQKVLDAITDQPLNLKQIGEETGFAEGALHIYIRDLRKHGYAHIALWQNGRGSPTPFYLAGNKPDAVKPWRKEQSFYDRKYREKIKKAEEEKRYSQFVPRRDIAASWF